MTGRSQWMLDDVAYLPTLSDNQSPHPTQDPGATTLRLRENRLEGGGGRDRRRGEQRGGEQRLGGEQGKMALGSSGGGKAV